MTKKRAGGNDDEKEIEKKSQNAKVSKGMLYICNHHSNFFSSHRIRSATIDGGAFGFSGQNREGHEVKVSMSHACFFISSSQ